MRPIYCTKKISVCRAKNLCGMTVTVHLISAESIGKTTSGQTPTNTKPLMHQHLSRKKMCMVIVNFHLTFLAAKINEGQTQ
jgi:hypothetical protein